MKLKKLVKSFAERHYMDILRIGLGLVFLAAGLHRIFFFSVAYQNFLELGIKPVMPILVITIIIEVICGFLLLINRFIMPASAAIGILLFVVVVGSFVHSGKEFFQNINELFILTATPTNIFLHVTYLIGIITLFLYGFAKKSKN